MSKKNRLHLDLLEDRVAYLEQHGKKPTTISEQIELLKSRNLKIDDEEEAHKVLADVGYYRLMGYCFQFKKGEIYNPDFSFWAACGLYELDGQVRDHLFSLTGRVEIRLRSMMSGILSLHYGSAAHLKRELYTMSDAEFDEYIKRYEDILRAKYRSGLQFVTWNLDTYHELPIWAAFEILPFGTVSMLYSRLAEKAVQNEIAAGFTSHNVHKDKYFTVNAHDLISWSHAVNDIRNICAHHERLSARTLKTAPVLHEPESDFRGNTVFGVLLALGYLYRAMWPTSWIGFVEFMKQLRSEHDLGALRLYGFTEDWWKRFGFDGYEEGSEK